MAWLRALVVLSVIATGGALTCWECNVYKSGEGVSCENPRLREDCIVCMKLETTVRTGYYKNKPRVSVIETKVCAKTKLTYFGHECSHYATADGTSIRCYCDTDLCNGATQRISRVPALVLISLLTTAFSFWRL